MSKKNKTFEHGEEGTHFACAEMIEKHGGKAKCCGCEGHKCNTKNDPECSKRGQHCFNKGLGHTCTTCCYCKKGTTDALPCPHGRPPMNGQHGHLHCPHCLGINQPPIEKKKSFDERFDKEFVIELPHTTKDGLVIDCMCSNPDHKRIIDVDVNPKDIKSFLKKEIAGAEYNLLRQLKSWAQEQKNNASFSYEYVLSHLSWLEQLSTYRERKEIEKIKNDYSI